MERRNAAVSEEIISVNKVLEILNSDVSEVESLCRKASLKPRRDELGNVYFSKNDIAVLKKVKELYEHTKLIQEMKKKQEGQNNVLARAKARLKSEFAAPAEVRHVAAIRQNQNAQTQQTQLQKQIAEISISKIENSLSGLQKSIIARMESLLSEKMDGLDEVVLELIRAKTENETLRTRLNELNKENFALKNEAARYKLLGMGLYVKKAEAEF